MLEVSVMLFPAQNVVGPLAVIEGGARGETVTVCDAVAEQVPPLLTVTV